MGRVLQWPGAASWPGFLHVSALLRGVSRSVSRLWPPELDLFPSPLLRWPAISSFSSSSPLQWLPSLDLQQLHLSVMDGLLWPLVVAAESVALAAMLCFFFLFCGCNI